MTKLFDLLADIPTLAVAKERLALALDRTKACEEENAQMRKRIAELEEQLDDCRRQSQQSTRPKQFVEHLGVLFKRLPTGLFESAVYCPKCKLVMSCWQEVFPFSCSVCHFESPFSGEDLGMVFEEVKTTYQTVN